MPEISRFYGIVIRMYYDDHAPAHFHVAYRGAQAAVRIDTLEISRGRLPRRTQSLVVEWALSHRHELWDDWRRMEHGEPLVLIAPLE